MSKRASARRSRLGLVLARDDFVCRLCYQRIHVHGQGNVDHIIPASWGGPDSMWNYRAAHFWCNTERGDASPKMPEDTNAIAVNLAYGTGRNPCEFYDAAQDLLAIYIQTQIARQIVLDRHGLG